AALQAAEQVAAPDAPPVVELIEHARQPLRLPLEHRKQFRAPGRLQVLALQQVARGLQRRKRSAQVVREPVQPGAAFAGAHATSSPSSWQISRIFSSSGGLTRWWSKPASLVRWRSSGWPQPVTATSNTPSPAGAARTAAATSYPLRPGMPTSRNTACGSNVVKACSNATGS